MPGARCRGPCARRMGAGSSGAQEPSQAEGLTAEAALKLPFNHEQRSWGWEEGRLALRGLSRSCQSAVFAAGHLWAAARCSGAMERAWSPAAVRVCVHPGRAKLCQAVPS